MHSIFHSKDPATFTADQIITWKQPHSPLSCKHGYNLSSHKAWKVKICLFGLFKKKKNSKNADGNSGLEVLVKYIMEKATWFPVILVTTWAIPGSKGFSNNQNKQSTCPLNS